MELGVRLPAGGPNANAENVVAVARWAEELGYRSMWVGDHVVLPEHVDSSYPYSPTGRWTMPADWKYLDPLLALAWAGAVAPSLKLGTSVLIGPLRNPILLAKQVSTLDYLTGGRVILGIGVGWMEEEFDLVGAPFNDRGKRAEEMVGLMRALWSGETVNFQGEYWQISDCKMHPRPAQSTVPVVWGGHSDAALRRVARVGDGWHPTMISVEQVAEGIRKLAEYCEQYGRDPASLEVIVRPPDYEPKTLDRLRELGVQQVLVFPSLEGPNLDPVRGEMEQVAQWLETQ